MDIKILEETKNRLKFELVGKTHTLANAVAKELWNDKDVAIAGYSVPHYQVSNAILVVETHKGEPKKALLGAISRLKKKNKELAAKVKKIN